MKITTRFIAIHATRSTLFLRISGIGEGFISKGLSCWSPWSEVVATEGRTWDQRQTALQTR